MNLTARTILLVLLGGLVIVGQGSGTLAHGCSGDENDIWERLLQASLEKTPEAKALVEQTAESPPSELVGALAQVLLEEWTLPPTADELRQPRVILAPKPDYSDLFGKPIPQVKSSVVVAIGEVSLLGAVEDVQLKIATRVEEIDERCLEAFKQWRYRPARGKDGYVTSKAGATCHINLQ